MFGSLGVPELLLIFAVILIVFGPRRIPEVGRMLGKAMGEFRRATDDLKNTIEREVRLEELKQITPTIQEFTTPFESISRSEPAVADAAPALSPTESPDAPGAAPAESTPGTDVTGIVPDSTELTTTKPDFVTAETDLAAPETAAAPAPRPDDSTS